MSHDRYFVDRLATKIIAVGHGDALVYPGTYEEYRWSQAQREAAANGSAPAATRAAAQPTPGPSARVGGPARVQGGGTVAAVATAPAPIRPDGSGDGVTRPAATAPTPDREERKRLEAEQRRVRRTWEAHQERVARVEGRIAECEREIKSLEAEMARPGFYEDAAASRPVLDRHQALMWEVGDRMAEWEALVEAAPPSP